MFDLGYDLDYESEFEDQEKAINYFLSDILEDRYSVLNENGSFTLTPINDLEDLELLKHELGNIQEAIDYIDGNFYDSFITEKYLNILYRVFDELREFIIVLEHQSWDFVDTLML